MTAIVNNNGEFIALSYLVGKTASTETLVFKLFTNNITPAETDSAGTYSVASGGGYADKTIAGGSWTVTAGAPSTATAAAQTWTFTGALTGSATIYGYLAVRSGTLDIVFAENFSAFTPSTNGDNLTINCTLSAE